jgi:hypothetical protein
MAPGFLKQNLSRLGQEGDGHPNGINEKDINMWNNFLTEVILFHII